MWPRTLLDFFIKKPIALFGFLGLMLCSFSGVAQTETIINTTNGGGETFIVPPGVTSITVEVWGAGGRGGTRRSGDQNGETGGGGGGGYSLKRISVTPGQVIEYYVGFGSTTTSPGEDTWFGSDATVMSKGGNSVPNGSTTGATGGGIGIGDITFSGGNGANASGGNAGGGGSSAGINANGTSATSQNGATAPTGGGKGGDGKADGSGPSGQGPGENGDYPGGGGGGAIRKNSSSTDIQGGAGGNGQIRISYIALTSATGTDAQFVCDGDPIDEITYSFPPGSTVTISNLPAGLDPPIIDESAGTISISGIPTEDGTYTIEATPDYNTYFTLTQIGEITIIPLPDVDDMSETVCSGSTFTLTPIDGTNDIVPTVTTYSWDAPLVTGGLTGGTSGSGSDDISGNLANPTNTTQTATYTVTPTHNGCDGDVFTVIITVDPTPTLNDISATFCTGDDFSVSPVNGSDGIVPAGTTYAWGTPDLESGLTGGEVGSGSTITGELENTTNTSKTATYTVTPTSDGCVGPEFTVTVTINPGPNINDISSTICSEDPFQIIPENGTNGIVPAGTTYTWDSPTTNGGLTGGAAGNGSSITGTLTNTTNSTQTATYTVTPSSGSCSDNTFVVTITVDPRPDITNMTTTVCSGEDFTLIPANNTNGLVPDGTTYTWEAPTVTGGLSGGASGSGSDISGELINPTNTSQTATYTVTPTYNGCDGEEFIVTITVDPIATIDDQNIEVCAGDEFIIAPANGTDGIVPTGTTYSWEAPDLESGLEEGAVGSGENNMSGTLINTTNVPLTATYTVTPTSNGCDGPEFTITVTVNPRPDIDDINTSICSEGSFNITPENVTDGIVPAGTTYTWTLLSVDPGISGGLDGSGNSISGTLSNSASSSQTAVYQVTPLAGSCASDTFSLTVTVDPKPEVTDMTETICSGGSFDLSPVDGANGIIPVGTTYSWDAPFISGELTGGEADSGSTIFGTLKNTSNIVQTATYTVTPIVDGCVGEDFEVIITVDPVSTITDISINTCSGDDFTINPANETDGIVPSGTTYGWELISVTGGLTGGADGSGSTISGTLTNPTDTPQTATYTVTPTSGSCTGPDFTVTVDSITEITIQPSAIGEVDCFGDGFDPISVTVVGGGLEYQWYSKTDNSDPVTNPGNLISEANSASFTPPSNTPVLESYYYYVVVTGNCGVETSSLSGEYVATEPETTIIDDPSTTDVTECAGDLFPELVVSAIGETDPDTYPEVTYQWFSNTTDSNTDGTLIEGATSSTFTPPSDTVGTLYYYAEAASLCGTVPTEVSGAHTVTPLTKIEEENLAGQVICDGDNFDPISVEAEGTGTISYQWYQNDQNSTTAGNIVAIGSDSNTFTPPSELSNPSLSETYYYFFVVSSECGPDVTSSVSGQFTVNPVPEVTNTELEQTICSGGSTAEVVLTSDVAGTTFNWSATASSSISGFTSSGSGSIPVQSITNSGTTRGSVTYTINPTANSCVGSSVEYIVYVDPLPTVTNSPLTQTVCSGGNTTQVDLTSDVDDTNFEWIATATTGVSGFIASGTGPIPSQNITTTENTTGTVTYEITPTANSCEGQVATYTIQVNPIPTVTNSTLDQTICSGVSSSEIEFLSDVSGSTFDWTVTSSNGVTGFTSSGQGSLPPQTISTTGPSQGSVTYEVTPTANGCSGPPTTYIIYVNPVPTVTNSVLEQTICSGGTTSEVDLTTDVTGAAFSWTASGSIGVSGFTSSGTGPIIPAETITTTGTTQGTITYSITPSAEGCTGETIDYIVKIDPLPIPTFTDSPGPEVCIQSSVTYTTQADETDYDWNIPGNEGSDYTILSGGISSESITLEWLTAGSKTVTVSYTDTYTGCTASSPASSNTEVEPFATVGPTSIESPSFCISDTSPLSFTQTTTGVTGIGTPTGLPPGISVSFNSSTGNIEFSGTATTTGFYSYNIPLTGNCINGLTATGTIDVTPEYELTSVSSVSATITGGTASITINGDMANLPNGSYQVNYTLDDGTGSSNHTSGSFSVSNGKGTFSSIPLTDLDVEAYELTIASIKKTTGGCETILDEDDEVNTTYFSVCGAAFAADGTFFVPAGVYEITIQAMGGGTAGQTEIVTIPVNPGQAIGIYVGEGDATGTGRDTWVTRDSSLPDPETSSYVYATGNGGAGQDGQVNISYSCPDANDEDCLEVVDDGAVSGTTIIRFTCDDVWEIPEGLVEFSIYAVGGGGMGDSGGGGGGAGMASQTVSSTAQYGFSVGNSLNITVGDGGNGAETVNVKGGNGENSTVAGTVPDPNGNIPINLDAMGGGGGASYNDKEGGDGASGGGGAFGSDGSAGTGGSGISGQGHSGGNGGTANKPGGGASAGGGGGGVGEVGTVGDGAGVGNSDGGEGGDGASFDLAGTAYGYGAGGGGIGYNDNSTTGNNNKIEGPGGEVDGVVLGGNGGPNSIGSDGTAYTGSGGGAGNLGGGNGGRGVVYITYFNFSILNVGYEEFTAKYNPQDRSGVLNWTTSNEWETSHFEIEKAVNNVSTWTKVGEVDAAGYSDESIDYTFTDTQLPASGGNIFYRLKQVGIDDDFGYSVTRSIQVNPIKGTTSWIGFPNPSDLRSPVTVALIDDSNYTDGTIHLRIADIRGVFTSYSVSSPDVVSNAVNSHLENARPGIYIVQVLWGNQSQQLKLIKK